MFKYWNESERRREMLPEKTTTFSIMKWLSDRGIDPGTDRAAGATPRTRCSQKGSAGGFSNASSQVNLSRSDRSRVNKARFWLSKQKGAVEGQGGHRYTFAIACAIVKGFDIDSNSAYSLMLEWNQTCEPPWAEEDIAHKVEDAGKIPDVQPRGYLLQPESRRHATANRPTFTLTEDFEEAFGIRPNKGNLSVASDDDGDVSDDDITNPVHLARVFLRESATDSDGTLSVVWWNDGFYRWADGCFDLIKPKIMRSEVMLFMESCFEQHYRIQLERAEPEKRDKVKKKKPSNELAASVESVLVGLLSPRVACASEPFWNGRDHPDYNPEELIVFRNRVIHIPSYIEGRESYAIANTPSLFTTSRLPYDFTFGRYAEPYDPPALWLKFLEGVWLDDIESIECLQEWMGYLLLNNNIYQKMLMVIGPPRSGKGTIIRVIQELAGKENICYPTFHSMSGEFGLQPLVGKRVAFLADARLSGRTDAVPIVERIVSITGGDNQMINRKHLPIISSMKLNCRFVVTSNEVPRLVDNSTAFASRVIALKMNKSFLGIEDMQVFDGLMPEIPAILRWSLDGLERLSRRGRFLQPLSGEDIIREIVDTSSPISTFLSEELEIGEGYSVPCQEAYVRWREWCQSQGREHIGDIQTFSRYLRSVVPDLETTKHGRIRSFVGFRLVDHMIPTNPTIDLGDIDFGSIN